VPTAEHERPSRQGAHAPGRPWLLIIASLLLAGLALWTGVQYRRSAEREQRLRAEIKQVYLEAETLRSAVAQLRERATLLKQQADALTVERDGLASRLEKVEAELASLKARRGRNAGRR
jgi:uncharacterized protein HemX